MDDHPGDGDDTRKVRLAVHSEMATVKRIQFWATFVLAIAGLGFGGAMYLSRYADASDVEKLADKTDGISEQLRNHISGESERMSVMETQAKNIEEDYHQVAAQVYEVAKAVGARQIPPPKHRMKEAFP